MKNFHFTICILLAVLSFRCHAEKLQIPYISPPVIDGKLEKTEWQKALTTDEFYRFSVRKADKIPSGLTRVQVGYNSQALFIGFRCEIAPGKKLSARKAGRDNDILHDEAVEIFIRPGKSLNFYHFAVSATGEQLDEACVKNDSGSLQHDISWNSPHWICAAGQYSAGQNNFYTVEIMIPWKTFILEPNELHLNFGRHASSFNENHSMIPLRGITWHQPENFRNTSVNFKAICPVTLTGTFFSIPVLGNNQFHAILENQMDKAVRTTLTIASPHQSQSKEFTLAPHAKAKAVLPYALAQRSGTRSFSLSADSRVIYQSPIIPYAMKSSLKFIHPVQRSDRKITAMLHIPYSQDTMKKHHLDAQLHQEHGRKIPLNLKIQGELLTFGPLPPGYYTLILSMKDSHNRLLFREQNTFNVIAAIK